MSLVCRECGQTFTFTVGEQEFFAARGFQNLPARCPTCRAARRREKAGPGPSVSRTLYHAVCADCGAPTEVPFQPREDRPVYCEACYRARRDYHRHSFARWDG
jgi:CxxC-x17-CxxC domain-containing protein